MSDLRELYQEVIIDHSKRPRNFHKLEGDCRTAEGYNPLCGDKVNVYLKIQNGVVIQASFEGAGCAISVAAASMMTDAIKNKSEAQVEALFQRFHDLVTGVPAQASAPELGKLEVFSGVCEFPVRVKCAALPWHTMHNALLDAKKIASTEEGEAL